MPVLEIGGLTTSQVRQRISQGRVNITRDKSSRSIGQILRSNVFTLFNAIIAVAMVMVLLTGQWRDSVFGFVIIVNTGIGIVTELKAKRTLDRLSILMASKYLVRRDGHDVEIAHDQIVQDDLLWVRAGDQVPADLEILRTWGLELDESMLTGESRTVRKSKGDKAYSGATAVSGMAIGRVTAVGEHSYAAKLAAEAKVYKKTHSDLNEGINRILKFMTFLVVPLCVLLIWTQMRTVGGWDAAIATGQWRQAVVSAVAGVVGMIPEGLVLLTSLNFAVAAMRLARKNTLVQELESVETLARVDSLNLDKTGTITSGGIMFDRVDMLDDIPENSEDRRDAMQALFDLANEAQPNGTGAAILDGLGGKGFSERPVAARIPFSSDRKWSAIVRGAEHTGGSGMTAWYMGAPEVVLAGLDGQYRGTLERANAIAETGSRVVLLAKCEIGHEAAVAAQTFAENPRLLPSARPVALVVCSEHIREDAERTLAWFREQGVRCRIISGDNPRTVAAIADKVRLTGNDAPRYMDARDLPDDLEELADTLERIDVLGRVLPEQKKAIVQALHRRDHTVAMTGDGVNDTLALKEADLGIAMGNAAPAAKAVAQVVLVDSKFSHLPDVVARGRQVMANMERVASLFLVKTVYSAIISLGVVLTAMPYPYLPRHITYVGALTIGIPAFILALAPNTRRYVPGFLKRVVAFALPGGIATGLSVLLSAWIVPRVMGWDLARQSDLDSLRATSAIILFLMGVFVLSRVASPLNSWRGALVAFFAACGVIGMFIPFVAGFFALIIPTGTTLIATGAALLIASAIFAVCVWLVPKIGRIITRETKTR
ncbi:HAD-IC family P-type ATPase [Bifidobacterium margollesii]|nr:HAD-IC family P-type ATPase [Bifidobacterium margollesii]